MFLPSSRLFLSRVSKHTSSGFTLIEILLVVTIMSILAVSGLRGMVNIQRSGRVNEMHDRFVAFLDIARSYALNGRLVKCIGSNKNADGQCIPKLFGVAVVDDTVNCPSKKKIVQFFSESNPPKNPDATTPANILDSYCLNPQISLELSDPKPTQFFYTTPFGEFSYPNININTTKSITLNFCDGSSATNACDKNALAKSITLYSNVGVPE